MSVVILLHPFLRYGCRMPCGTMDWVSQESCSTTTSPMSHTTITKSCCSAMILVFGPSWELGKLTPLTVYDQCVHNVDVSPPIMSHGGRRYCTYMGQVLHQ